MAIFLTPGDDNASYAADNAPLEIYGLGGNDTIDGSAQTNAGVALEITGGAGNDSMTGGAGADAFVFGAETGNGVVETDLIIDYSQGEGDVVDLSAVGNVVNTQVVGGNLRLTLAGGDNDILIIEGVTNSADVRFFFALPTEPGLA